MAIIKAATSPYDFNLTGDVRRLSLATPTWYSALCQECIVLMIMGARASLDLPVANEFWLKFHFNCPNPAVVTGSLGFMLLRNKTENVDVLRMRMVNATNMQILKREANGAYTPSANFAFNPNTLRRFDIHVKLHATEGVFTVYRDGTQIATFAGDVGGGLTIDELVFAKKETSGNTFNEGTVISAVIVADEDTRSFDLYQRLATADGAHTSWAGGYADISDNPKDDFFTVNTTTFIETKAYDNRETFTGTSITSMAGRQVKAVVHSAYGITDVNGDGVKTFERIGGNDGTPTGLASFGQTWGGRQTVQHVNPATGLPWTITELETAQFGVISAPAA